jgi:hypothetical protein
MSVPRSGLALGLAVLMALGVAGCGSESPVLSDADREKKYNQVINDAKPSADDVIEIAGAPTGVARADDGSLLLSYNPSYLEDDEGPAAFAWRLYSPEGKPVAEHAVHSDAESYPGDFTGVEGGFVFNADSENGYFLDVQGKRHKFKTKSTRRPTERGDAGIEGELGPIAYRPSTREVTPIAGVPNPYGDITVDDRGTAWLVDSPSVVWSRDGRDETQRLPEGYNGHRVAANGGTAVVTLIPASDDGFTAKATALFVTSDSGATWKTVKDAAPPAIHKDGELLDLEVLADGRILVSAGGRHSWLGSDSSNRTFRKLNHPAAFTSVRAFGDTLYAIADSKAATYDFIEGEGLWTSKNGGRSWSRFDDRESD